MELICGWLLQKNYNVSEKCCLTMVQALIANSVFGKFKKVVNYKFKNEKQKKKVTCYNYVAKGHFIRKCFKKKQN